MKKMILSLLVGALVVGSAFAGTVSKSDGYVRINAAALADDAIDTVVVDIRDALWALDTSNTAGKATLEMIIGNLEQVAADSLNLAIDIGAGPANDDDPNWPTTKGAGVTSSQGAWQEVYGIANDAAHLDFKESKAIQSTVYGQFLRVRIKNVSGAALTPKVYLGYMTK